VLVTGLLLVGLVAAEDGLFASAGAALARAPGGVPTLYALLLALVAIVTVVLNLDTAVLFLTPVLVHAARSRGADERAFLYGAVFMSNSASLLLPGSNLTNLLVLAREDVAGATFALRIWPAWSAAVVVTALVVGTAFPLRAGPPRGGEAPRARKSLGLLGTALAAVLVLALRQPALPVLALGVLLVVLRRAGWSEIRRAVSPHVLGSLFVAAVALGTLARSWSWPDHLLRGAGPVATAAVAAATAVLVNNLPASVLLSAHVPAHPRALLIGLDLGPNLFVTGSLSAFLWLRAARGVGASPSIKTYARVGLVLAPLSIAAALLALKVVAARHL
jgi:arsenical pump membrane protein